MNKIITAALALLTLGMIQLGIAEDAKTTTYEVTMTGVTWAGCKAHVRAAFKKLDGIVVADLEKDIQITKGDKPNTQKVIFKSTSAKITKEAAIKSIGDQKDTYVVKELKIATAKKK